MPKHTRGAANASTSLLMSDNHSLRPRLPAPVKAVYPHFDKLIIRTSHPFTNSERKFLRANCTSVSRRAHTGHPIRGSDASFAETIVNPNQQALAFLATRPGDRLSWVEPALDMICEDEEQPTLLHDFFDFHFVHPWHGKHQTVWVWKKRNVKDDWPSDAGRPLHAETCSGQRHQGHSFAWYSDRASKITGETDCFHFEGRYIGAEAISRIGLRSPADLVDFDHVSFWARNLKLYDVHLSRLGRYHLNRLEGARRRTPRVETTGPLTYDWDTRTGGALFRVLSVGQAQSLRSVQTFVDRYGRGPFLGPAVAATQP